MMVVNVKHMLKNGKAENKFAFKIIMYTIYSIQKKYTLFRIQDDA